MLNIHFKPLIENDFIRVKEIYDYYILNSTATFHVDRISIEELQDSIYIEHPIYLSYGIYSDGKFVGFTYLSPYKKRQAYNRSAEVTLYFNTEYIGKGWGKEVLNFVEDEAEKVKLKNLLAVICSENKASIQLFENHEYIQCAHFKNIGEKFNRILDVVMYQKELV